MIKAEAAFASGYTHRCLESSLLLYISLVNCQKSIPPVGIPPPILELLVKLTGPLSITQTETLESIQRAVSTTTKTVKLLLHRWVYLAFQMVFYTPFIPINPPPSHTFISPIPSPSASLSV